MMVQKGCLKTAKNKEANSKSWCCHGTWHCFYKAGGSENSALAEAWKIETKTNLNKEWFYLQMGEDACHAFYKVT